MDKVYKRCRGKVKDSGERCKKPAVLPNTFRTIKIKDSKGKKKIVRTNIVNDHRYCQMHQPDKIPKCNCDCHKIDLKDKNLT